MAILMEEPSTYVFPLNSANAETERFHRAFRRAIIKEHPLIKLVTGEQKYSHLSFPILSMACASHLALHRASLIFQ